MSHGEDPVAGAREHAGGHFRWRLKGIVTSFSMPYGYTLAIAMTTGVVSSLYGHPHLLDAMVFIAGGVMGFLAVEAAAYGTVRLRLLESSVTPVAMWANVHLVTAGLAVCGAYGAARLTGETGGWAVSGFVATVLYLVLTAAQMVFATRHADGKED